jgi:hypothetical protein
MKRDIDRMVAGLVTDHDTDPGLTPGARELLAEIIAAVTPTAPPAAAAGRPALRQTIRQTIRRQTIRRQTIRRQTIRRPIRRPIRRRLVVALAAGLAGAAVVLSWIVPGTLGLGSRPAAAAPLDIRQQGAFYIITVKNLLAAPRRYEAQLWAHGIPLSLRVVPASPSVVGTIDGPFDSRYDGLTKEQIAERPDLVSSIERPGACAARHTCIFGLRVPVNYKAVPNPSYRGMSQITLGRAARPGERYQILAALQAPGEPLHCVGFIKKRVDRVLALLREHGVARAGFYDGTAMRSAVPGSWYVQEGFLSEPGKATLLVSPTRARPDVPGPIMTGDMCAPGRGH